VGDEIAQRAYRGFTIRSIIVGAGLSFFINVACPYVVLVKKLAGLTSDYITAGAVMLFFVLVGILNPVLKKLVPRWAFSSAELVLIYIMMIIASAIPTWGLVTNLFHILTRAFYVASPENQWETLIHPYIPAWLAPKEDWVSRYFYDGLPHDMAIPWSAWIVPMFWWCTFMMAVYIVMIAMMVIVRKQWVENEKLAFPIIQPALEMLKGNDEHVVNPLFKQKLFWIAFWGAFALVSTSGINHYFPTFPEVKFRTNVFLFRRTIRLVIFWNFAIIGLTYFINLEVAASLWLFHLLSKVETGIFNVAGFTLKGRNEALTGSSAATAHQGAGAMIVLCLVVLWAAREHLKDVFRKALTDAEDVDDSNEIMSYRMAVIACVLGTIFILGWFHAGGMPWPAAIVFTIACLGIFFAITRVVALGGIGFTAAQMIPQPFVVHTFGTEFLGPAGLTNMSLTYSWAAEMRTSVMTSAVNGLKLSDAARARGRRLFWAMVLAAAMGLAGAIWITITLNYKYGGANMRMFGVPYICYSFLQDKLKNPVGYDILWPRWVFTGVGMAAMGLLVAMRYYLSWWPVHYVGFALGDAWVMGWAWWSVFLCWLVKYFILKFGGQTLYERYKPLFLGMICGQLMCGGTWMIIDFCTAEVANYVYIGVP